MTEAYPASEILCILKIIPQEWNTTMEIYSPTINPTSKLDAACHTDSRRVYGETLSGISMYS
jgi:hypothetical protein